MLTKRPFFIVGTPRSGTTLLQAMFMRVPGVFFPPETQFLGLARRCELRHGPVTTDKGFSTLLDAVLDLARRHELPIDAGRLTEELRDSRRTTADLFDMLLWHIQQQRPGCRRLGEKSPGHLLFAAELLEMFPDGRVITIIRDARDVAISQEQSLGRSTLRAVLGWRRDEHLHARYERTLPADRYTSVRYEDLVTRPEQELRRLCAFVDEPYCDDMLRPEERADKGFAAAETHKALTMQPVTTARIGRYRGRMSASKIALVQAVAGRELRANGYELERVPRLGGYLLAITQLPDLILRRDVAMVKVGRDG